ncbi:short transient receptor potential channel 4-associated protein-like [Styela clava]
MTSSTSSQTCESDFASKKPRLNGNGNQKPQNIVSFLRNSTTNGKRLRRYDKLPQGYIQSYQERFNDVGELPVNVRELFDFAKGEDLDLKDVDLLPCLKNIRNVIAIKSKPAAEEFCYAGGIEIIIDILVQAYYDPSLDISQNIQIKKIWKEEIKGVLCMLQILVFAAQLVPVSLSHFLDRPHLLHFLFSCLAEGRKQIFADASFLLEEGILSSSHSIDMKKIACLRTILEEQLPYQQEAHLFHIISTILSAHESHFSGDASLAEEDNLMVNNAREGLDQSHNAFLEYLIGSETFLKRLFKISCRELAVPVPDSLPNEPMFPMINSDDYEDPMEELRASIVTGPHVYERLVYQNSLYVEKSIRSDALLLLSVLLTGKYKDQMQKILLEHKVVQSMEKTAESIIWTPMRGFLSMPESRSQFGAISMVKIQFLRFIYSISDHHLNRYLLLSKEELNELQDISEKYCIPLRQDFADIDRDNCCLKHPGILTSIVQKMKAESDSSRIRFWMARALEAFLRGKPSKADQIFFMKKGLLEELFRVLLSTEQPRSWVIQGHFDLLATLMKGSVYAFRKFAKIVDSQRTFLVLCNLIETNLVDSNMFIRCVILTINNFGTSVKDCRILEYYNNRDKRVQVIASLIAVLCVEPLSQDNVCCLNTCIIILYIAWKNNELPRYLSSIFVHGSDILKKLLELLGFWLKHYSYSFKQNDVKSLEEGTWIAFSEWKALAKELINEDTTSPNAIKHHLASGTSGYDLRPTTVASTRIARWRNCSLESKDNHNPSH